MIVEYTKDGRPLWFSVVDERGEHDLGDRMLSSALWAAITHNVDTIEVYAMSQNDDEEDEHIDSIDVNKLARKFCEYQLEPPLQYAHIATGGFEVQE